MKDWAHRTEKEWKSGCNLLLVMRCSVQVPHAFHFHFLSFLLFLFLSLASIFHSLKNLCGSALSTLSTTTIQFETYAKSRMNKRTHFLRVNLMRQPFSGIKFNLFETTLNAKSPFFFWISITSFSRDAINILYVSFLSGTRLHWL